MRRRTIRAVRCFDDSNELSNVQMFLFCFLVEYWQCSGTERQRGTEKDKDKEKGFSQLMSQQQQQQTTTTPGRFYFNKKNQTRVFSPYFVSNNPWPPSFGFQA
jgi:hypothetical protein